MQGRQGIFDLNYEEKKLEYRVNSMDYHDCWVGKQPIDLYPLLPIFGGRP